ncbi:MAG: flagellar protein FlgN [Deltaproteobacteria bacterium]|nr:flagellar protein FlgN [Deltaproteobacteria bacterium]MBW2123137.1 flagellar protein FlgN [Deltaproteobacteria bacterium]
MEFILTDLSDLLARELEIYRSLLSLLQQERRIVVDCSIPELIQATKEKENLVLKIRILEQSRQAILQDLAGRMGLSPDELTLSALEARLEEPLAGRLRSLRSNLSAILRSIQEANEENRVFLQHSADFVRGSLALIRYLAVSSPKYAASGVLDGDRGGGRFLSEKA